MRRYFCPQSQCPRRSFAERLPGFVQPYARTSDWLRQAHSARQVVDQWDSSKNLREAIERLFERQFLVIGATLKTCESMVQPATDPVTARVENESLIDDQSLLGPATVPSTESPRRQAQRERRQGRVERFEQVHERHRQGHSLRRIARDLGMSRYPVRRYLRCKNVSGLEPGTSAH